MTSSWLRGFAPAVCGVFIFGCAHSTVIRTGPPGAKVWINGTYLGTSPVGYEVRQQDWPDRFHYRAEEDGYLATEGDFEPMLFSPVRIVAAVFTAGISLLVWWPRTLHNEYYVELQPLAPGGNPSGTQATASERLRQLEQLKDQGLISEEEYKRHRSEILREL